MGQQPWAGRSHGLQTVYLSFHPCSSGGGGHLSLGFLLEVGVWVPWVEWTRVRWPSQL